MRHRISRFCLCFCPVTELSRRPADCHLLTADGGSLIVRRKMALVAAALHAGAAAILCNVVGQAKPWIGSFSASRSSFLLAMRRFFQCIG